MGFSSVYSIHGYSDNVYKVIAWKRSGVSDPDQVRVRHIEEEKHTGAKLDSNFSRARSMVLQYALCNSWQFFFTGTLDKSKFNRYDLDTYATSLSQFIRDQRKKWKSQIQVLLVPEKHQDGAWHIHGFISGLPDQAVAEFPPYVDPYLISHGYKNYPDYMNKFGFCSLGRIHNPTAASFYLCKYVSKGINDRSEDLGKHLYFHSRPLRKAEKLSDVYLFHPELERFCVNDYEFCKTGMVQDARWDFPYKWEGADFPIDALPGTYLDEDPEVDSSYLEPSYEQINIFKEFVL